MTTPIQPKTQIETELLKPFSAPKSLSLAGIILAGGLAYTYWMRASYGLAAFDLALGAFFIAHYKNSHS